MPRIQLEVAVALAVSAAGSSLVFFLSREKEGKIQLPIVQDGTESLLHEHDPFDVTRPEDTIDGYPIEPEKFWQKMRLRKMFLSFILSLVLILETIRFGWLNILEDSPISESLIISSIHIIFVTYLLVIAVHSINQDTARQHGLSVIHLAVLSLIAAILQTASAIIPNTPRPVAIHEVDPEERMHLQKLWYGALAGYIITAVVAMSTPRGPPLYYPPEGIYSEKTVQQMTNTDRENVSGVIGASPWSVLFFSYTTKVVWLGNIAESLEIGDLPIVAGDMRATFNYTLMRDAMKRFKLRIRNWGPAPGSGWGLAWKMFRLNIRGFVMEFFLASISAVLFYSPAFFLRQFVTYLEIDIDRKESGWGWVYVCGLFAANVVTYLITGQLWSLATTTLQVRMRVQLNSILFAKTLVRKNVASASKPESKDDKSDDKDAKAKEDEEEDFSSKAQIMTLMTTDVDRVSEFAWHMFALIDSPVEICIGTYFLYHLLGPSCFFGLAVVCLSLPLNHWAGKIIVGAQDNLMKARDERVALMNEVLGAIRMLKFMAWERSFEARILKVREKELRYQRLNYNIEVALQAIWSGSPILVTLASFWHYAVVRQQSLTPAVAFTSIIVFSEMRFALNALPETFINILQSLVSLRRIEKYLNSAEVASVPPLNAQSPTIAFQSCTVTWPQDRGLPSSTRGSSIPSTAVSTPRQKFVLVDLNLQFPPGEISLICGKLGSGKSLLLLSLLGEADILAGQLLCPRTPPDAIASFVGKEIAPHEWVIPGVCAYVPQAAWLRNASIKENILFNLPYDEERYRRTLEVCALISDLDILEDGDESEIGERGVNLSGGQKARVSLARAVYSRASILLLDDVLSAVDAHTAHHLFTQCLQGDLMQGRTIILVSHHVQLCAPGAQFIVALDNGRVIYQGDFLKFQSSGTMAQLVQSVDSSTEDQNAEDKGKEPVKDEITLLENTETGYSVDEKQSSPSQDTSEQGTSASNSTVIAAADHVDAKKPKKAPRKLVEEERRAVGRIGRDIWESYVKACGGSWYWAVFIFFMIVATLSPVVENGWLRYWSNSELTGKQGSAVYYLTVYAIITLIGVCLQTIRWFVLYNGSVRASTVLYKRLLESVLFANIRFHDTVSRGRLLNRFGKDFEGIDSKLSDHFGRSIMYGLSALTTWVTVCVVGGPGFILAVFVIGLLYFNVARIYGQTSRDMRRLDSVTRSPLYSLYGETISGVTILRAFGASSKFLRDMLKCVDTNSNPYYWMWSVNRWLSIRFNMLSSAVMGLTALVCLITPSISAALAGFALAFASTLTNDILFMVRRFVGLEQAMVALERVKEYSELAREPPEYIEPRPPKEWPPSGHIECQDLVIRYAPELPNVLHKITFEIKPGEKVGILGRTGSGKSTLALSFFRFVEATEGRIMVDGIDIANVGLTDLRSRLTIIPQDPTILSGSLRSTLDVFDEYEDAEIFEALRRVHLIPSEDSESEAPESINVNVFRNLDFAVSEGGENFSTGEKQLLCMARAILKRSRILVMDEATASVDYATDELIGKTIRQEFASSTILTIAHRLRTVIDYDKIMLLDQGRIVEFDRPSVLLSDPNSKFYSLCKATGKEEFAMLKKLAGVTI
ncbi:hypothetical protein AX16_005982 [Volvariella volvacea WC 439]|nr:hypothetical protein AX16_005982 [Volvariella volvacea WC 439]